MYAVQALQKIGQLRQPEAFAGWLRSITNRMAINRVVRKTHDQPLDTEALEMNCIVEETPLPMFDRWNLRRFKEGKLLSEAMIIG